MGLNQTISDFTHVSDATMNLSLIDHFVTSDIDLYRKTGTIAHGATDHYIIYATRKKAQIAFIIFSKNRVVPGPVWEKISVRCQI